MTIIGSKTVASFLMVVLAIVFLTDGAAAADPLTSSPTSAIGAPSPTLTILDLRSILDLHSVAICSVIPFSLSRAASLSVLSLAGNSLNGDILATFGGLQRLTHLNLSRNTLNGSVLLALAALSNLSLLDCSVFSHPDSLSEPPPASTRHGRSETPRCLSPPFPTNPQSPDPTTVVFALFLLCTDPPSVPSLPHLPHLPLPP